MRLRRAMQALFVIRKRSSSWGSARPVALFPTRFATGANLNVGFLSKAQYAVAPDGRFLMNVGVEDTIAAPITIVLNWTTALKK